MFSSVMIVYEPREQRRNNYAAVKQTALPDLRLFSAIDSVSDFAHHRQVGVSSGLVTERWVDQITALPGKLGCNLSHLYVLQQWALDESDPNQWLLVMEDDVSIAGDVHAAFASLLPQAEALESQYIQLYTNPRYFLSWQTKPDRCVGDNLYRMIPQWHACAYLIHREGARKMLQHCPIDDNIDHVFSHYIPELQSLCYINNLFEYRGALEGNHKDSEFGSIIYDSYRAVDDNHR